jgi:hypothetical protein
VAKFAEVLERLAALEAAVAKIEHNGGPPLDEDDDESPSPKALARPAARQVGRGTLPRDRANPRKMGRESETQIPGGHPYPAATVSGHCEA